MSLSHAQIWKAIDQLAARHNLSPSGLARRAGLDATSFNPSKRHTGRKERWPSTGSISRILTATQTSLADFLDMVNDSGSSGGGQTIPIIGMARAGKDGFFDDGGFPVGNGWDSVVFPDIDDPNVYALTITGDSMEPVYSAGQIIIVSPAAQTRKGDRVVVKTTDGEIMAKILARKTQKEIELRSFNPAFAPLILSLKQVEWLARILWAGQ